MHEINIKPRIGYEKKESAYAIADVNKSFETLKYIFIEKVYPNIENLILQKIKIIDRVIQLSNYTFEFTFKNGEQMDFYFSIFSEGHLITRLLPSKEILQKHPMKLIPYGINVFLFNQEIFIKNNITPYCEDILNHNKNIEMVIDKELHEFLKYSFCDQRIVKKSGDILKFYEDMLRNEEFKLANQVFEKILPVIKFSDVSLYISLFTPVYQQKIDLLAKEKFKNQSDEAVYVNLVQSCPPCNNFEKMIIAAFYTNLILSDEAFKHFLSNPDAKLIDLVRLDKLLGY